MAAASSARSPAERLSGKRVGALGTVGSVSSVSSVGDVGDVGAVGAGEAAASTSSWIILGKERRQVCYQGLVCLVCLVCRLRFSDWFPLLFVAAALATLFGWLSLPRMVNLPSVAGIDGNAGGKRIERSISLYLGRIEAELATPHESCPLALLDNGLKEAAKDRQAVAGADTAGAGVVGQGLVEGKAEGTSAHSVGPLPSARAGARSGCLRRTSPVAA